MHRTRAGCMYSSTCLHTGPDTPAVCALLDRPKTPSTYKNVYMALAGAEDT